MKPDFDKIYQLDPDPWKLESSWYEQRKLDVLLAALPREHYASAWEPGCGLGVATERLAQRCDRLTATDASTVAVRRTRARCAPYDNVTVDVQALPALPTRAPFELVVAAEFVYYLPDVAEGVAALWRATAPGGQLVLMHWRHRPHDGHLSGEALHADIERDADVRAARQLVAHVDEDFRLDVYEMT